LECGQSLVQSALIALEVKTKSWDSDDVELEAFQRESSVPAQLVDTITDVRQGVFGEIDDHRSRGVDLEAAQASGSGCHRDRQIESQH